ncbi:MAG: phosphatase PAP2 family protein, partial [Pseudomonadales bacterium]
MRSVLPLVLIGLVVGCQGGGLTGVPELRPGVPAGYLSQADMPDSLAILPTAPAVGSATDLADQLINKEMFASEASRPGSNRWRVAAVDVDLSFPGAEERFQCALGTLISEEETPILYLLLRRSMIDAGLATYAAKNQYARARPFMVTGTESCTPDTAARLRQDGSYPSGHASLGWAWALILSEIDPLNADALLLRGYEFGQSRAVCNVHWQSDVNAGRLIGAAAVALLHRNEQFRSDLASARQELETVREK